MLNIKMNWKLFKAVRITGHYILGEASFPCANFHHFAITFISPWASAFKNCYSFFAPSTSIIKQLNLHQGAARDSVDNSEVGNSPTQPVGSSWMKSVIPDYLGVLVNNILTRADGKMSIKSNSNGRNNSNVHLAKYATVLRRCYLLLLLPAILQDELEKKGYTFQDLKSLV